MRLLLLAMVAILGVTGQRRGPPAIDVENLAQPPSWNQGDRGGGDGNWGNNGGRGGGRGGGGGWNDDDEDGPSGPSRGGGGRGNNDDGDNWNGGGGRGGNGGRGNGGRGGNGGWGNNNDDGDNWNSGNNGGRGGSGGRGNNGGGRNGGGGRGNNGGGWQTTPNPGPATTVGAAWYAPRLVSIHRLYSPAKVRHHYHTDLPTVESWKAAGYNWEVVVGKVISMEAYQQYKANLDWACQQLVELKSAMKYDTDTQYINAQGQTKSGFSAAKSLGYCVRSQACGATKALRSLTSNDGGDILYTSDSNEFDTLNGSNARFRGTGSEIICWMWA